MKYSAQTAPDQRIPPNGDSKPDAGMTRLPDGASSNVLPSLSRKSLGDKDYLQIFLSSLCLVRQSGV